jgi:hypothetical protein
MEHASDRSDGTIPCSRLKKWYINYELEEAACRLMPGEPGSGDRGFFISYAG